MKKLFVLDASGFLFRSYFAIRGMTNPKGESTNAIYGFIRSYQKLIKDFNPDYVVAVFDGPQNSIKRETIFPEYKANRIEPIFDLGYQIDWARDFCEMMGIPLLNVTGVEADDTMATVAKWAEKKGATVYLCTSDKDMCQIVNDKIHLLNTHKDNLDIGPEQVEQIHGIPPEKMVDYLAIMGDSSDNIPGLPGFGPKTAASLLQKFGSLDYILDHPEEVPGKKKQETIVEEREKALISRKLVTLDTEVEIPEDEAFYRLREPKIEELRTFYHDMNFTTLLREMETVKEEKGDYRLVNDEESLEKLLTFLKGQKEICFDTETTAVLPLKAELVGIGFGVKEGQAWYVPVNENSDLERFKPLFEDEKIGFYGHNVKYDLQILGNYGIKVKNICFDTILASYILAPESRQHSLDTLSLQHFNKVKIPTSDLIGKGKKQITMREVPIEKVSHYCCEDVDYTIRLKNVLEKELEESGLKPLFKDVELPLIPVLAKMERHGIFLDVPKLKELSLPILKSLDRLKEEIYQIAGEAFNLNSPKQMSEILYDKLGIKSPKKGKSTAADVLTNLQDEHPIIKTILEYRMLEKLRSTYIEKLPNDVSEKTGRIHCTFNQTVAATGRLSCQDPNLQNIPVRTEEGKKIREAFRPEREGWSYLSADYSQVELRLLAHFSEDPTLITAFKENQDIHKHTASEVLGIPLDEVTPDQRRMAKAVNFGILYGQQAFGLSQGLNIDVHEAAAFIDAYFLRYYLVASFIDECKAKARREGKATTLTGRERALPEIHSKNFQIRALAERLAVNTPIQGTAADLMKKAMLNVDQEITKRQLEGFVVLQIHDELIFEVPDSEIDIFKSFIPNAMENVFPLKTPLVVDIHIGKNWKEC